MVIIFCHILYLLTDMFNFTVNKGPPNISINLKTIWHVILSFESSIKALKHLANGMVEWIFCKFEFTSFLFTKISNFCKFEFRCLVSVEGTLGYMFF